MAMIEIHQDFLCSNFMQKSGELLYKNEAINNLILGLSENLMSESVSTSQTPLFLSIFQDGNIVASAVQTPPFNLIISTATQNQLKVLAEKLIQIGAVIPGVVAPVETCELFAQIWSKITGKNFTIGMSQKIYTLEQVIIPEGVGEIQSMTESNLHLVAQWISDFSVEALPSSEHLTFDQSLVKANSLLKKGSCFLWRIENNFVSMACMSRPTKNGVCINGVYTPKTQRKNGYASLAVAHLCKTILDSGKSYCCLYTDANNPTSNHIYQNIGFREIAKSLLLNFV